MGKRVWEGLGGKFSEGPRMFGKGYRRWRRLDA